MICNFMTKKAWSNPPKMNWREDHVVSQYLTEFDRNRLNECYQLFRKLCCEPFSYIFVDLSISREKRCGVEACFSGCRWPQNWWTLSSCRERALIKKGMFSLTKIHEPSGVLNVSQNRQWTSGDQIMENWPSIRVIWKDIGNQLHPNLVIGSDVSTSTTWLDVTLQTHNLSMVARPLGVKLVRRGSNSRFARGEWGDLRFI